MKEDKELHNDAAGHEQPNDAATNEPRLHASNFTPSESRTTNIPPRLPVGFTYDSPEPVTATPETPATPVPVADEQHEEAAVEATPASTAAPEPEPVPEPEQHPDMPDDDAPLRSEPIMPRRKQPRRKHPNHTARRVGAWCKRYALWVLLAVVVIGAAASYQLWTPLLGGWGHDEEPAPVIAADTLPKPKPVERDTMVNVLTHEDSLRIQDSVRHARWLYWQRYKSAKSSKRLQRMRQRVKRLQHRQLRTPHPPRVRTPRIPPTTTLCINNKFKTQALMGRRVPRLL